jgi:hypothetical protein
VDPSDLPLLHFGDTKKTLPMDALAEVGPLQATKRQLICEFERAYFESALYRSGGNIAAAARASGKARRRAGPNGRYRQRRLAAKKRDPSRQRELTARASRDSGSILAKGNDDVQGNIAAARASGSRARAAQGLLLCRDKGTLFDLQPLSKVVLDQAVAAAPEIPSSLVCKDNAHILELACA